MPEIKPYGDSPEDGMIQMSFTLPMGASERARQVAVELSRKMELLRPHVVHMKPLGPAFTFFVVYGATHHSVDPDLVDVPQRPHPLLSPPEVNRLIRDKLKRQMVVIGACTGSDAHTVGLDAILSMKGFAGDKGLEYYQEMRVLNLGAQVTPEEIVEAAARERADAVLVSQVVTQRDAHVLHLQEVCAALERTGLRRRLLLVGGGPRFNEEQAAELGYDRIFGRGTKPSEVASYLAWALPALQPEVA